MTLSNVCLNKASRKVWEPLDYTVLPCPLANIEIRSFGCISANIAWYCGHAPDSLLYLKVHGLWPPREAGLRLLTIAWHVESSRVVWALQAWNKEGRFSRSDRFYFSCPFFLEGGHKVTLETQASGSRVNKHHAQVAVASLEPRLGARGERTGVCQAGRITTAQAAANSLGKDKTGLKGTEKNCFSSFLCMPVCAGLQDLMRCSRVWHLTLESSWKRSREQ